MNFIRTLLTLLLINLFWSCRPEPRLPSWDLEVLTPLANSRLDIKDIFIDSSLTVNSGGALSLVFTSDVAELKPDEILTPLNASFSNTLTLKNINLGTPSFYDFISLGQLSKGGSPAGQFIIANHGNTAVIPTFLNVGPKSFLVNASYIFQDITLLQGSADVVFQNELPVALTDINFRLENESSGLIIFQDMIDTLPANQTISRSFDLSGQTIEGNMKAILQNFSSPGSGTNTVFIDTSDRITVTVTLKNLRPSSATAIFPDQNLATDTNYSDPIPASNALLTSILVDRGSIYLDATSTLEDLLKLDYQIPGALNLGRPLMLNQQIPPAPPGGSSSAYKEVNIAGYNLDLTGQPGDVGIYNQFYTILNARIDSSGRLINLSTNDSVVLNTGVIGLTARRGYGYLGIDTLAVEESSNIEVFGILESGSFDLEEAVLGFSVENYIGAPLEIKLNDMVAQSGQSQKTLVWDKLGQFINVPAASPAEPVPVPGYSQVYLNSGNSNFDELIELQPNQITTNLEAIINGATSAPIFNQFIYANYGVRSSLFLEIPMHLSLSDVVFTDTSEFNYEAFDPRKQIQDGTLKVLADNYFPVQADLMLIMLDINNRIIDSLTSANQIIAPVIAANGKPIEAKRSVAEYPLDELRMRQLYNTHRMLIRVTINTPASSEKVRLYEDNYMDLTLTGDLRVRAR